MGHDVVAGPVPRRRPRRRSRARRARRRARCDATDDLQIGRRAGCGARTAAARARREGQPDDLRGMARGGVPRRLITNEGATQCQARQPSQRPALLDGLASGAVEIVDLTQPLTETTPVIKLPPPFANTPGLTREEISHYDDRGPAWAWYTLTIGEHVGTHLDAPIHWVTGKDGADVGSIDAEHADRPGVRDRQDRRDRGRQRLPADRRRPRGVGGRATAASPTAPGCCSGPAGSRAPTTRPRSSTSARTAR